MACCCCCCRRLIVVVVPILLLLSSTNDARRPGQTMPLIKPTQTDPPERRAGLHTRSCMWVGSCARQVDVRCSMFDAQAGRHGRQPGCVPRTWCRIDAPRAEYKGTDAMRCGTGFGTKRQRCAFPYPETRATNSIACDLSRSRELHVHIALIFCIVG
jgi:hypothetical protein